MVYIACTLCQPFSQGGILGILWILLLYCFTLSLSALSFVMVKFQRSFCILLAFYFFRSFFSKHFVLSIRDAYIPHTCRSRLGHGGSKAQSVSRPFKIISSTELSSRQMGTPSPRHDPKKTWNFQNWTLASLKFPNVIASSQWLEATSWGKTREEGSWREVRLHGHALNGHVYLSCFG